MGTYNERANEIDIQFLHLPSVYLNVGRTLLAWHSIIFAAISIFYIIN